MLEENIDLQSIEQEIQIARSKLGSALDQLDTLQPGNVSIDRLHTCVLDVQAEADRLLDMLHSLPC